MYPVETADFLWYFFGMRKNLLVAVVLSLVPFFASAKIGVGVQCDVYVRSELPASHEFSFKDGVSSYIGDSITIASNHTPWVFALQLKGNPWYVGVAADNWFVYKAISSFADYYFFWGVSGGMELEGVYGLNTGARAGVGINVFLAHRHLELYAQGAWNPCFGVNLKRDDGDLFFVKPFVFPLNLGLRLWM